MIKNQSVVFFIGAGFSAPFGLPVMSNFIDKARDLFFYDPTKYKSIGKTLELISKYSSVKNYLNVNLHNIEDLLSIAYMESAITKKSRSMKLVIDFIKVVIENYTGKVSKEAASFAELIANASFKKGNTSIGNVYERFYYGKNCDNSDFGLISLNYDLIVENALSHLALQYGKFYELAKKPNPIVENFSVTNDLSGSGIPMAKLHGSINRSIIPPTWNKNMNPDIRSDWDLALKLLRNATHIVFLGYSLPSTDNYIKYLLATSLFDNQRLKKTSVITKDSDGQTTNRYKSLFDGRLSVHNVDILSFFEAISLAKGRIDFDEFDDIFIKLNNSKKQQN